MTFADAHRGGVPRAGGGPSTRALAKATALAFVGAMIVLVTVVLPAEYGVDPLGTGRALGLSALSAVAAVAPVPPPQGDTLAPTQIGQVALYPGEYKFDAREIVLGPYEYAEFKYHLEKGATMLFSWTASGDLMHDFHGDPDGAPSSAAESYDRQPRRRADGSFIAPFSGIHGWFWENPGAGTITIRLTTAGFYTSAHQFRYDGTRQSRAVRALETIAPATEQEHSQ
ncbi:MAG: hypothetical protein HY824_17000 [Acidobacteria bacterium]|nr:hypothetical protein [Acidobacteriota bacterium]